MRKTKIAEQPVRIGTIVTPRDWRRDKYVVAQVSAGMFLLIHKEGNRYVDLPRPLSEMPRFLKKEGFVVVSQGGFK